MAKLEKMSKAELAKQKAETEARLKEIAQAEAEYDGRRIKELRSEIEEMLKKEGYSLADLFGGKSPKKASGGGAKSPAKYRHPENASVTWSGRGRQPVWYKEAIAAGKTPEDLAI